MDQRIKGGFVGYGLVFFAWVRVFCGSGLLFWTGKVLWLYYVLACWTKILNKNNDQVLVIIRNKLIN